MKTNSIAVPAIVFLLVAASAAASGPVIGMASAGGGIRLNGMSVSGNATLFNGDTIQTDGYSRISLSGGARVDLAAGSKAQVFAKREVLEAGMSEMQSSSGFEIDARTLRIRPSSASSIARVRLDGKDSVLVTALNSPINVLNKDGFLVARVLPGAPLSFLPQAASAGGTFDNTGCILQKGGSVVLVDETGAQVFELRSTKKIKFDSSIVGGKAHVVGAIDASATPKPGSGAQQVVVFGGIKATESGGCTALATKLNASAVASGAVAIPVASGSAVPAATSAAATVGLSVPAAGVSTGLIVGGVAAAAGVGIGAAVAASGGKSTSP